MTDRQEMIDFIGNRTDPEMTRRILRELDDPQSFASQFIDEFRWQAEHLFKGEGIGWKRVMNQDDPSGMNKDNRHSAEGDNR